MRATITFLTIGAALCSGCSTFQQQAAVSPLTVVEAKAEYCTFLSDEYSKKPKSQPIFEKLCYSDSNSGGVPKDYVVNLMMFADMVCARELSALSANQRTVNASLSTTSTLFSSAATVITGGLADDIVSGFSTLAGSTRDHINSEVYRKAEPELVTRLIQANRVLIAEKIALRSSEKDYSWQQAIFDANTYHQSCSYYQGLALLTDSANEKADDLVKEAQTLNKGKPAPPNTVEAEQPTDIVPTGTGE